MPPETVIIREATEKRTHESDVQAWGEALYAVEHITDVEQRNQVINRIAELSAQLGLMDQFVEAANNAKLSISIVYEHLMPDGHINRLDYATLPW